MAPHESIAGANVLIIIETEPGCLWQCRARFKVRLPSFSPRPPDMAAT